MKKAKLETIAMNQPNGPSGESKSVSVDSEHQHPIECRNLWKIYGERDKEALEAIQREGIGKEEVRDRFGCAVGVVDASFSVNEGEIFCIMGLSGSGKSTLVRHVNRLIEPTAGEVYIEGADVNRMNMDQLRQIRAEKIGMVFQNMALLPHRNVRQNVAFALELRNVDRDERNRIAEKALDTVQLKGWGHCYPDELSGGMQQRVGLARALAADPSILLMDEPFSALDPLIRSQLQVQFLNLSALMKKTTLFITHDLDEAIRIGNRIAIMKDGVLVQIGTPEEIVAQPADDYVADFVAGISRLHLVYAHSVMRPKEVILQRNPGMELDACPVAKPDTDLNDLIDIMVKTDQKYICIMDDDACVGVVTRSGLLRGVQGKDTPDH
jgi:glycine betaine/proline transport system ATP-binding protein